MFSTLGLSVPRCFAYIDDDDKTVRINGDIYCNREEWSDGHQLKVKANLCDADDAILSITCDFERKTFFKVRYESFSIYFYKRTYENLKYVEIYPKVEYLQDGED